MDYEVHPAQPGAGAESVPGRRRRKTPPMVADARRLARLLTCGVRTIRTWDASGKIPAPVRVSGRTLWYLPEIRAWLRAGAPDRDEWEARKAAGRRE